MLMINEISFSEVYDIILHLDTELVNKIPVKFIRFIEQNKKKRLYNKYRLF